MGTRLLRWRCWAAHAVALLGSITNVPVRAASQINR
jgi:hypothetical protein